MLTRVCLLLTLAPGLVAAACSSSPMVALDADAGPDGGVETAPDLVTEVQLDGPALTQPQSYVVHGVFTLAPQSPAPAPPGLSVPTIQDFTMHIDPIVGTVIVGNPSGASRATLSSNDGLTFETTSALRLNFPSPCPDGSSYSKVVMQVRGNAVQGVATGTITVSQGDVAWGFQARLDFTGTGDVQGPTLGDSLVDLDPLEGLSLKASEPLPATVAAHLSAGDNTLNLTPLLPQGTEVITGFNKPSAIALRYGTTYDVVVAPWTDLIGNSGQPLPKVTTRAAPPLATEDGFEGATSDPGGARITSAPELPPISGLKSALLVPRAGPLVTPNSDNRHMTLRLPVQAGDTVVRFSLRRFGAFQSPSSITSTLRLAVPGGAMAKIPLPAPESLTTSYTNPGDGRTLWLGETRTIEAPLPAGASTDVVFDFKLESMTSGCGLFPPPASGYQIDDLRVE